MKEGKKMHRSIWNAAMAMIVMATLTASGGAAGPDHQRELLAVRESVWRAWFTNDAKLLQKLAPIGTIVISAGEREWKNQAEVLRSAAQFQAEGGRLVRLDFPRTEVQHFGSVAIIYSQYQLEIEVGGKRQLASGRVTEIFVRRHGQWTNPGWHTDSEQP